MMTRLAPRIRDALREVFVDETLSFFRIGRLRLDTASGEDLANKLADGLYWHLHAGVEKWAASTQSAMRDADFELRLRREIPHSQTRIAARVLGSDGNSWTIDIDGLRVRLPRPGETCASEGQGVRETLLVDCVRPRLSPGFVVVDGSLGRGARGASTLRIYVHLNDRQTAPKVWGHALRLLEKYAVPYRAKIAAIHPFLARQDALVIYLGHDHAHICASFATEVSAVEGVGADVSPFTYQLATGVSMAWESHRPRPLHAKLSFGQHRSSVVAAALIAHARGLGRSTRPATVADALANARVDPARPWQGLDGDYPEIGGDRTGVVP